MGSTRPTGSPAPGSARLGYNGLQAASRRRRTFTATMLFGNQLTAETQLRIHLAKAHDYWRQDRLDLAMAAIHAALRVGVEPGGWYDLQRTIEAEMGARAGAQRLRVGEHLILEADPARWGDYWPDVRRVTARAAEDVAEALSIRWGRPVLVTFIPDDRWVEFMHARYGYYWQREETHKVCLPPSAVYPPGQLRRAVLHEVGHAAVHQLAGDAAPRWLDEGTAVLLEGGSPGEERRRFQIAVHKGARPRLDEVSAGFESLDVDIGTPRSLLCYAAAGDFVTRLQAAGGTAALRECLRLAGASGRVDRAFKAAFRTSLGRAEASWHRALDAESAGREGPKTV